MSAWLGETLVATTLLMALVLLARPLVRRAFGAGAAYALWLVPAIRLVMPPLDLSAQEVVPAVAQPIEIVFAASGGITSAGGWLLTVWALGAALFAAWHIVSYRRFLARVLAGAVQDGGSGAAALSTDAVAGPAAVGLLRRRILLPRDFATRFDPAERDLALRHERVHLSRGDLWANAAALGMLALHWFNPLAYLAYRAFRDDQELSCDAAVIADASGEERAAYGSALVKSAQSSWGMRAAPTTICPMTRTRNLKRRLKMVRTHRKSALASTGGLLTVGLVALCGLTLTATSGFAAEPVGTIKKITVKRINGGPADVAAALGKEVGQRCDETTRFETRAKTMQDGKPVDTRFILCGKGSASPADRLAALEKVRANMATSSEVDAEQRAKILAGLDRAIAQLKAQN